MSFKSIICKNRNKSSDSIASFVFNIVIWRLGRVPMALGEKVILKCETNLTFCDVRQFFGGAPNGMLLYSGKSSDSRKYVEIFNKSTPSVFSLVIKNTTEADLNVNYACSYGKEEFQKKLQTNNDNFIRK